MPYRFDAEPLSIHTAGGWVKIDSVLGRVGLRKSTGVYLWSEANDGVDSSGCSHLIVG